MSEGWPETETRWGVVVDRYLVVWRGRVVRVAAKDREHCRGRLANMVFMV